jgi:lipid-binding SYLF domain-containing protein
MKYPSAKLFAICLVGLLLGPVGLGFNQASPAASAQKLNSWTQAVLSDFRAKVPEAGNVLRDAKGILVFPHLYNGGLIFGGKYAEGELLINDKVNGFYNLIGLSWGWQIGGQRQALIITFMTDDALRKFVDGSGWDLGADATVAVVDAGTQGSLNTSRLNKPVLVFAINQKGLMAGVSLQGSKVTKISK